MEKEMKFELPALPYTRSDLEPHISEQTIDYHYGKHHAGYVKKLNKAVSANNALQGKTLLELIRTSHGSVFNNAAQVWNHTFYWHSMCPASASGEPSAALHEAIVATFGSIDDFRSEFKAAASSNFASGWTWLVKTASTGVLSIVNTNDAETPVQQEGLTPLLTLDVWEHAYYLDRQNARGAYVDAFWSLINWEFASQNFSNSDSALFAADT